MANKTQITKNLIMHITDVYLIPLIKFLFAYENMEIKLTCGFESNMHFRGLV
jgi:hypothetical protein